MRSIASFDYHCQTITVYPVTDRSALLTYLPVVMAAVEELACSPLCVFIMLWYTMIYILTMRRQLLYVMISFSCIYHCEYIMLSSDVPYTDGQCLIRLCWWSELRTIVKCMLLLRKRVSVLFPTVSAASRCLTRPHVCMVPALGRFRTFVKLTLRELLQKLPRWNQGKRSCDFYLSWYQFTSHNVFSL